MSPIVLRSIAAMLFCLPSAPPALADGGHRMILRYRIVYDHVTPPRPDGRDRWSENAALRITLTADHRMMVEGVTGSTAGAAAAVHRRDGEVVDAGTYRVVYRMPRDGRIEIHTEFADLTIDRIVEFSDTACSLKVDYTRRPGHDVVVLQGMTADGPRTAAAVRAVDATCRIDPGDAEEPAVLDAGCHVTPSRDRQHLVMRVSSGATCGTRRLGAQFTDRRIRLLTPPAHGAVRIRRDSFVQYLPSPGYFGSDRFVVEVDGTHDGVHETRTDPVDVEVVH